MNALATHRQATRHWWHGAFSRFAATTPGAWIGKRLLHHLDRLVFRLSDGRLSAGQLLGGISAITVTATGARSGLSRSVPLNEIRDGGDYILIASNWGNEAYPAWYHNIRANPRVTVTIDQQSAEYIARQVLDGEKERAWGIALAIYPGYEAYRRRLKRPVPVFVLSPVKEGANANRD